MSNREAFEKWFELKFPKQFNDYLNGDNVASFYYTLMIEAWQARVPEGYVVVPVKCTNNMAHAAKEVDGRLSAFKYGDVWKAMIEAVEK